MKLIYVAIAGLMLASCGGPSASEVSDVEDQLSALLDEVKEELPEVKEKDPARYYNDDLSISVKNNDGWEIKENYENIPVFFMSPLDGDADMFQENINMVNESAPGYSLSQYYDANLKNINLYLQGFEVVEEPVNLEINGETFKKMAYKHSSQGIDLKVLVYFAVKGGKGYVINCTALTSTFEDFRPQFEALANSFMFE